jgi:hypothetical protein
VTFALGGVRFNRGEILPVAGVSQLIERDNAGGGLARECGPHKGGSNKARAAGD